MSTKGASNRYGNSGYGKKGHKTIHIGYAWAKDFKKTTLGIHVKEHMKSLGLSSPESYKAHSVEFANRVDRDNHVSYVRKNGETVKFSKKTGEFAVITKNGIVTTYYKPDEGYAYYNRDRRKHR